MKRSIGDKVWRSDKYKRRICKIGARDLGMKSVQFNFGLIIFVEMKVGIIRFGLLLFILRLTLTVIISILVWVIAIP